MRTALLVLACVAVSLASAIDKRVVGGSPARKGAHPYMASIWGNGNFRCSGVLISRGWVATAASCVDGASAGSLSVVVGDYSLSGSDDTEQTFGVSRVAVNPGYKQTSGYPNNIALVGLRGDANVNDAVRPLSIATLASFAGDSCEIVGWGKTNGNGGHSDVLNSARVHGITNDACARAWAGVRGATIFSTHICAQRSGVQACNGDSGSPLVCGNSVAGFASWGEASCAGNHPSTFTRASSYAAWISSVTG